MYAMGVWWTTLPTEETLDSMIMFGNMIMFANVVILNGIVLLGSIVLPNSVILPNSVAHDTAWWTLCGVAVIHG